MNKPVMLRAMEQSGVAVGWQWGPALIAGSQLLSLTPQGSPSSGFLSFPSPCARVFFYTEAELLRSARSRESQNQKWDLSPFLFVPVRTLLTLLPSHSQCSHPRAQHSPTTMHSSPKFTTDSEGRFEAELLRNGKAGRCGSCSNCNKCSNCTLLAHHLPSPRGACSAFGKVWVRFVAVCPSSTSLGAR